MTDPQANLNQGDQPVNNVKEAPLLSQRQTEKFVDDQGYMYTFEKKSSASNTKFWRCDRRNHGCKGRLHTDAKTNEIIKATNTHNHAADALSVKVAAIRAAIVKRAESSLEDPDQIISEEMAALGCAIGPFGKASYLTQVPNENDSPSMVHVAKKTNDVSFQDDQEKSSNMLQRNLMETLIKDGGSILYPATNEELKDLEGFGCASNSKQLDLNDVTDAASPRLTTQRLREKFVDEQGYMFTFEKHSSDYQAKFWRCDQRNYGCKVRIHTNALTNRVTKVLHTHNHDVNAMSIGLAQVKSAVKRRAKCGTEQPSQIINEEMAAIGSIASSSLNHNSLKRTIQRNRASHDISTPNSLVLYDLFNSLTYEPKESEASPELERRLFKDEDIDRDSTIEEESPVSVNTEDSITTENNRSQPLSDNRQLAVIEDARPSKRRLIETKRQRQKYVDDDGFMYTLESKSSNSRVKFWRCDKRSFGCKVRLHTNSNTDDVVKVINSHNHDTNALSAEVAAIQSAVKKRAQESSIDASRIIDEVVPPIDYTAFPALKPSNLRRMIQRKRGLIEAPPPNPGVLDDLFIPQRYHTYVTATGAEENFLLHDSGPASGSNRILVFGRESSLDWIKEPDTAQEICIDGTFRLPPGLYKDGQMYVVLLNKQGWMLPLLYALLPNKERATYDKLFAIMRSLMPTFNPTSMFIDYEVVAFQAVRAAFPSSKLYGCSYHFAKNMHRYLSALPDALRRYRTEAQYALKCKAVAAIAFVPVCKLDEALETLKAHLLPDLRFLVTWLQDIYIGHKSEGDDMCVPLFPPSIWNVNERMLRDLDHCGNLAEASFRRLKSELGIDHPNFWKLIENLKKVQRGRDTDYKDMMAGVSAPTKRKKFFNADVRILKLLKRYAGEERGSQPPKMWELLQGIACNIDIEP